jgi:peroxiredoxin
MFGRSAANLVKSVVVVLIAGIVPAQAQQEKVLDFLKVGDSAPDVEFSPAAGGEKIKLSSLTDNGPVVLIVLRGWPGYQCPICFRQVGDLVKHADDFQRLGVKVVLIYPGPAPDLDQRATDFLADVELPEPFLFVIDPDYAFTDLYHLRWDEPRETAYPSTFVLDPLRVVKFRKTSFSHGDRAKTDDVIETLEFLHAAASATGQEIPQDRGTPIPIRKR